MNLEVTFHIPTSIPIKYEFFQDISIPSPISTVTTPITIAPCLPVCMGALQTQTPLFTNSTSTTTTSTVEPPVSVNTSDVRVGASGFTVGQSTPPISHLRQDDPNIVFGEEEEDFGGFTYSPFNIRTASDDEAPVTKGQLKDIKEKLNLLL